MRCVLVVAWLWVACASPTAVPDFGAAKINVDREGALTITSVPDPSINPMDLGYVMKFSGTGVQMPTSLSFATVDELLGINSCAFESLIGISVFPAARAVGGESVGSPDFSSNSEVEIEGLAIVRVRVDYSIPYTCGIPQLLQGQSTFTFFPRGRIVRHDKVSPSSSMLTPGQVQCGCAATPADAYFFTSFWTFAQSDGVAIDPNNNTINLGAGNVKLPDDQICMSYSKGNVGLGFTGNKQAGGGLRAVTNGATETIALPYDFIDSDGTNGAPSVPPNTTGDAVTRVQLAPPGLLCSAILDQVQQKPLSINGVDATLDESGFYRDTPAHANKVELTTRAGGVFGGFTVALDLGQRRHARVTKASADGVFYIPDFDPISGRALFWFRDNLLPGETITIEPLDE